MLPPSSILVRYPAESALSPIRTRSMANNYANIPVGARHSSRLLQTHVQVLVPNLPTYLPISWSPPADANKFLVLVNSGDSDVRLYRNSSKTFSQCKKVEMNAARVAYDTMCPVDVVSSDANWIGSIIRKS